MQIVFYTSDLYEQLMFFLIENFPNRDKRYLNWWLKQTTVVKKELLNRTFLVMDADKIVACTTASWNKIKIYGQEQEFYWEGNTIVSKVYRGKGIGRMIYEQMGRYLERCTTGFTKAAYDIQPKIIPHLRSVSVVFVYLFINRYFFYSLYEKMLHHRLEQTDVFYPSVIKIKNMQFCRIDSLEQMVFTPDGFWQNDDIEIIRDKSFFLKRFFDIYKKYVVYEGLLNGELVCYFVVRLAYYKGFNIISLVDFRYKKKDYMNNIDKAVSKIAKMNHIGFALTLTSLKKQVLSFFPIVLRTNKKIYGGTTFPGEEGECSLLITSADSDLDFVYYS
jgi:GNAT superfamily N-acetyltransferase